MARFASCGIATETPPDPTKHVHFTAGMVLGVDDFTQEFAFLHGRDTWLARDAIGYGTLSGLAVTFEPNEADTQGRGPRVAVTPGVAIGPGGELIQVATAQCAYVNAWLAAHSRRLLGTFGSPPMSPPGDTTLYVVLRYRSCPTDEQPIPGEPCRTEEQFTAPSRCTDDYLLELRLAPPAQREEAAVRDFVAWLAQVEIGDVPHTDERLRDFLDAIRGHVRVESPPVESPPLGEPPLGEPVHEEFMALGPPPALVIPASHATEYLRAAFRLWTTELRPAWRDRGRERPGDPPAEEALLLATLRLPTMFGTDAEGREIVTLDPSALDEVVVDEERRPYLLQLRMIQEWLLGHGHAAGPGGGGGGGPALGDAVVGETAFDATPTAGSAMTASRSDHTHGTPPSPSLDGDATGPIGDTTVERLQRRPVAGTQPSDGQVLTFAGGQWQPANVPAGPRVENVVVHPPDAGDFELSAAGAFEFSFGDGTVEPIAPTYNKLEAAIEDPGNRILRLRFSTFEPLDLGAPDGHRYIVKALPWQQFQGEMMVDLGNAFTVSLLAFADDGDGFLLIVNPLAPNRRGARGRVMVEVSRYRANV